MAFGALGIAITALAASVYFRDPDGRYADAFYLGGAQLLSMIGWAVFIVLVIFIVGEDVRRGNYQVTLNEVENVRATRAQRKRSA
jgi:uncharacterized membrane protein